MTGLVASLVRTWWVALPAAVGRRWRSLGDRLTDGIYLVHWPPVGAVAPVAAAIVGLSVASLHDGPAITTSRLLMAAVVVVGAFGVGLGVWLTVGYAVGYYLWAEPVGGFSLTAAERWLGRPGAFLYAVLLVWLLAVAVGMVTLAVRVDLRARGWEDRLGSMATRSAVVVTTGIATYFVTKAMPVLVRPVFVWRGRDPTAEAVVPIQDDWWIVVVAALAATAARLALERPTSERVIDAVVDVSDQLRSGASAAGSVLTPGLRLAAMAALLTFLLAPLLENLVQAAITLVAVMALLVARGALARSGPIRSLVVVPLLVRYGIAVVASWFVTDFVLGLEARNDRFRTDSFVIALISVLASLAVFLVATAPNDHGLDPPGTDRGCLVRARRSLPSRRFRRRSGRRPSSPMQRSRAVLAAALLGLVTLWPRPAAADNCGSLTDCFSTLGAALAILLALAVVVALIITFPPGGLALAGGGLASGSIALSAATVKALVAAGVITIVGGTIVYMASSGGGGGGRRSNNQSENRKFREAVRRIEQRTGRKLSKDDVQRLHREISKQGLTMDEIVEWGVTLFGG